MATEPREYAVRLLGVSTEEEVLTALDAVGGDSSLTDVVPETAEAPGGSGPAISFECTACQLRGLADALAPTTLVIERTTPEFDASLAAILYGDAVEAAPVAATLAFERRLGAADVTLTLSDATVKWTDQPSVRVRVETEAAVDRSTDAIAAVAGDVGCRVIPPARSDWS